MEFVRKEAVTINERFQEYKEKVQKVVLTEKNVFNSLFTLCTFDNNEG